MNVTLAELAANSDISENWNNQSGKFVVGTFYTTFDSPYAWMDYIKRSERKKMKKTLNGRTIHISEIQNGKIWKFSIKDNVREYPFYIGASDKIWIVFTEKKAAFNNLFKSIVKYSKGIDHAWISPSQMTEIIENYANIGTLQTISKSPSFKIPKRAPIPMKTRTGLPDLYFKEMSATVQFWAPREGLYSQKPFAYEELKISKDYMYRISKSIFNTKFDNPGKSKISVENDSIVCHERGVPKATEIVFESAFKSSSSWIDRVEDCIPEFDIRYNAQGDILTLHYKKRPREMYFSIGDKNGFSMEQLVKLEQMLISGSERTELCGYRVSTADGTISVRTMYPRFGQDASADLTLENKKIYVAVFPHSSTGPHILAHIYRVVSERFAWSIDSFEVRERWGQKIDIQT